MASPVSPVSPREALGRLGRRQALLAAAGRASRRALVAAAVGLVAMVTHTELEALAPCQFGCLFLLELLMSGSTVVLLLLLLLCYRLELQASLCDVGARHWLSALRGGRAAGAALELLLCALHPPPRLWPRPLGPWAPPPCPPGPAPWWRRALALAMLARVAPAAPRALRALGGGAWRGGGASAAAAGALGHVAVGGAFALRALLRRRPARVLVGGAAAAAALGGWALVASERAVPAAPAGSLPGALWLLPVTLLTVGYGDVVPVTAGGRLVCLAAGATGVCCSALLVALLAEWLQFSRSEQLLYDLLQSRRGARQVRAGAARLLQAAWRLHREPPGAPGRWRRERRLLLALEGFRDARIRHRKIQEDAEAALRPTRVAAAVAEVAEGQRDTRRRLERLERSLEQLRELLGAARAPGPL